MLTYCFESSYVARTLAGCRKNDLAVVDTEGVMPSYIVFNGTTTFKITNTS